MTGVNNHLNNTPLRKYPANIYLGQIETPKDVQPWIFTEELQVKIKPVEVREDDLYQIMKKYLIWGQLIGLLPYQFIGTKLADLEFKRISIWSFYLTFATVTIFANCIISVMALLRQTNNTPVELAYSLGFPMFYFNGFFIFQHFYRRPREFLSIFKRWSKLMSRTTLQMDKTLLRFIRIYATIIFTSAILENAAFHIRLEPSFDTDLNAIAPLISALYAWNYVDLAIAIFSKALATKLKHLRDGSKWNAYESDYKIIVHLFRDIEAFLSPLVFYSYLINIFSLCLHLNLSLTPSGNKSIIESLYSNWSFIHLILRLLIVTLSASSVNKEFQAVHVHIQTCPKELFTEDMERLERMSAIEYALDGLGTFTITGPFILSIINVLFTFEIVLLQTSSSMMKPPAH